MASKKIYKNILSQAERIDQSSDGSVGGVVEDDLDYKFIGDTILDDITVPK